jgi:Kef-type K+ transport system membrane component KefB
MESCASDSLSLAYTEPELTLILTVGGFIVLLNVVGSILDKSIHSGLIGQLILGALLGTPLAHLFPPYIEQSIQVLGYLGLLLLLAEGGMDARLDFLFVPSTFFLSLLVGKSLLLLLLEVTNTM